MPLQPIEGNHKPDAGPVSKVRVDHCKEKKKKKPRVLFSDAGSLLALFTRSPLICPSPYARYLQEDAYVLARTQAQRKRSSASTASRRRR